MKSSTTVSLAAILLTILSSLASGYFYNDWSHQAERADNAERKLRNEKASNEEATQQLRNTHATKLLDLRATHLQEITALRNGHQTSLDSLVRQNTLLQDSIAKEPQRTKFALRAARLLLEDTIKRRCIEAYEIGFADGTELKAQEEEHGGKPFQELLIPAPDTSSARLTAATYSSAFALPATERDIYLAAIIFYLSLIALFFQVRRRRKLFSQ